MNLDWKYGNRISKDDVIVLETKFGIKYPKEYVDLVLNSDEASPTLDCWDIPNGEKEKVFDHLISLSGENENNVFNTYLILKSEFGISSLIPFGADPYGNYICFMKTNMKVYYYDCDTFDDPNYTGEYVADSFSEFICSLYEYNEQWIYKAAREKLGKLWNE